MSVGRNGKNRYGSPKFQPSVPFTHLMKEKQSQPAFFLDENQRNLVVEANEEVAYIDSIQHEPVRMRTLWKRVRD